MHFKYEKWKIMYHLFPH